MIVAASTYKWTKIPRVWGWIGHWQIKTGDQRHGRQRMANLILETQPLYSQSVVNISYYCLFVCLLSLRYH